MPEKRTAKRASAKRASAKTSAKRSAKRLSGSVSKRSSAKRSAGKRSSPKRLSAKRSASNRTSTKRPRATTTRRRARQPQTQPAGAADQSLSALEQRLVDLHRGNNGGRYADDSILADDSAEHVTTAYEHLVQRGLLRRHPMGSVMVEGKSHSLYARP